MPAEALLHIPLCLDFRLLFPQQGQSNHERSWRVVQGMWHAESRGGGQAVAQVLDKAHGGRAAAGQLGGEAARHRPHRATLMGASVKQQAAMQVCHVRASSVSLHC